MKIAVWNAAGKFREKYQLIDQLKCDIHVVSECEDPNAIDDHGYRSFCTNGCWTGIRSYKGLGIFARPNVTLSKLDWPDFGLRHFLPVAANDIPIIGVWTSAPGYIEELFVYLQIHQGKLSSNMLIAGDLNSNAIWDHQHWPRNHSAVTSILRSHGLRSLYHHFSGEEFGEESISTFFQARNPEKGYHIDYIYADPTQWKGFQIIRAESFLAVSDHRPLVCSTVD